MSARFITDSVIRGHHVSKSYFTPVVGRILPCVNERGNVHDIYAVAVKDDDTIVGHVPRAISSVCHMFLNKSGTTIHSEIVGNRIYSRDLPQGGLEIPCRYIFEGPPIYVDKVKRFINAAPCTVKNCHKNDSTTMVDMNRNSIIVDIAKTDFTDDQSTKSKAASLVLPIKKEEPTPHSGTGIVDVNTVNSEVGNGMGIEKHAIKCTDDAGKIIESLAHRETKNSSSGDNAEANFDHDTKNDEISSCSKRGYSTIKEISDMPDNNDHDKPAKISKIDATSIIDCIDDVWLQIDKISLTMFDKAQLSEGNRLNDHHINYAQCLLKRQFTNIKGLYLTLLQNKKLPKISHGLQIIFCSSRRHWIVASTIACVKNEVKIYDSLFSATDAETRRTIYNLFQIGKKPKIVFAKYQRQIGTEDCGAFAIAVATAIAFGINPSSVYFQQEKMRSHLLACFEKQELTPFPTLNND